MIETERLQLIAANGMHLAALVEDERKLAELLGVELTDGWLAFPESAAYALRSLEENPQSLRWGMHFFLHKADNALIGTGGFKGLPDADGTVEIGYAVAPGYENRGYATEAARGLIEHAFSWSQVKAVDAHTLAEENASGKVLAKCGMTRIAEKRDEEDSALWHWRISREEA